MKKLPILPKGTKILFMYQSNEYINLVEVNKDVVRFYLWDGESDNPNHILLFPRTYLKDVTPSQG